MNGQKSREVQVSIEPNGYAVNLETINGAEVVAF